MTMLHLVLLILILCALIDYVPRKVERYTVARLLLSRRGQRRVLAMLGKPWPIYVVAIRLAKQMHHDEGGVCLPCHARMRESQDKHAEKRLPIGDFVCAKCGLPRTHWTTLPKCRGKH